MCRLLLGGPQAKFRAHEEFGDRRENVVTARTYFYEDEEACEENLENFMQGIDAVSGRFSINCHSKRLGAGQLMDGAGL